MRLIWFKRFTLQRVYNSTLSMVNRWILIMLNYHFINSIKKHHRVAQRYLLSYPWIELLLYAGVVWIGIVCVYSLSLKESWHALRQLQTQTQSLHQQYRFSRAYIAHQASLMQLVAQKKLELSLYVQKFITHQSILYVFQDLQQIAQKNTLQVISFSPQHREMKQFYTQIPLHVVVLGKYKNVVSFLMNILKNRYSITLHDFQLEPYSTGARSGLIRRDPVLKLDMFLHVYLK